MRNVLRRFLLFYIMGILIMICPSLAAATGDNQPSQVKLVYSDMTLDNSNYVFVTYLAKRGIFSGFSDGTFHPDEGLTRAQAAVIIDKAAGLAIPVATTSSFKDVSASHWAVSYIVAAEKAGYLKGFAGGTFHPDDKLTRAQAISLVMRISTQKERDSLPVFQDMSTKHWAAADMATALQLNMIGSDGQKISPDMPISRAGVARALAILLTQDPGLNRVELSGKVADLQGDISLTRGGATQTLTANMSIVEGDVISSSKGSKAEILYPDGSSTLIDENTVLAIKNSEGRSYIKRDGTPGIAVEFLDMDVREGIIFGALAAKRGGEDSQSTAKEQAARRVFASRDSLRQLAATGNNQPWYKSAQTKKVKIKVDMPWGVAAVRGTFYKVTVNKDGSCKVSCLTGNVDLSSTNGSTVPLVNNQTSVISSQGRSPTPATAMDPSEVKAFELQQKWLMDTAIQMDLNQEALSVVINVTGQPNQNQSERNTTTLQVIISALQVTGIHLTSDMVNSIDQQLRQIEHQPINPYEGQNIQGQLQGSASTTANDSSSSGSGSESDTSVVTYSQSGTYGPEDGEPVLTVENVVVQAEGVILRNMKVLGNVTVNRPSVMLHSIIISGNLVLGDGIGEGDATLEYVTVAGNTAVYGGGVNSIHLVGCSLNTVTVDKENNAVRIVAEGNTSVGTLTLNSGATLEESGVTGYGFSDIVAGSGIPAGAQIILSGSFDSLVIDAPNLNILLESGSITDVHISSDAANTSLNLAAGTSIGTLTADATASITGTGEISSAVINVDGVEFEQAPLSWSVMAGVTVSIAGAEISVSGTVSHECSVTGIATLTNVLISDADISGDISDVHDLLTVAPTISEYATWELYSDASCTTLLEGNNIDLTMITTVYIKVTAQDGITSQVYTLSINPVAVVADNTECNVLAVADLTGTSIEGTTILGQVSGTTGNLTITPTLSEGATFQIYSDAACSSEIFNPVAINAGTNTFYMEVIAQDTVTTQVYVLRIYRPSNSADVTSPGGAYTVGADAITNGSSDITTSVTVATFLNNLAKDPEASWKVVVEGTTITDSNEFDGATAKTNITTMMFDDILAVKAGDGTINTYNISVELGNPTVGAGPQPPAPAGLKINSACTGFIWGKYKYFAYDFVDDRNAIAVVAFDSSNNVVGQWERSHGQSKYVTGYSIDIRNQIVKFSTNKGNGIPVNFAEILIPQP